MKKIFLFALVMGIGISVWAHDVKIKTVNEEVVIENRGKNKKLTPKEKKQKIEEAIKNFRTLNYGDAKIISDKKPLGEKAQNNKKIQLALQKVEITQITEGNDNGDNKNKFYATSTCTTKINNQDWNLIIKWKGIKSNNIKAGKPIKPTPKSFSFTKIEKPELQKTEPETVKPVTPEPEKPVAAADPQPAVEPTPVEPQPDLQQANEVANNFKSALSSYATKRTSADKSKLESMFVDKNAEVQVSNLTAGTKTEKAGQYLSNLKAKNAKEMNITLKEPEVRNNGNEVVYPYAQQFASDSYRDHTDKKLHLKKVGETYKITKIDVIRTGEYK